MTWPSGQEHWSFKIDIVDPQVKHLVFIWFEVLPVSHLVQV